MGLSDYEWIMNRGLIFNKISQRRMVVQGPGEIEPVFQELEHELGGEIHLMVVEAQRRFARSGFYSFDDIKDEDRLRKQFALYGIGNLRSLKVNRKGLSMRLDNATMHLIVTGMMQGVFEMAFNVDSKVGWELSDDGKLQVEVKPRG
jgi:hypothetical protein